VHLVVGIRPAIEQPSFALSIKRGPVFVRNPEKLHIQDGVRRPKNDADEELQRSGKLRLKKIRNSVKA
jgi:hypothetical protein